MLFVRTLGTALIDAGDTRVAPSSSRKFGLLLHLTAEPGRVVSRSTLHDLMFPGQPEKNARHSLRELLYQFRQSGVRFDAGPDGIELEPGDVRRDYDGIIASERLGEEELRAIEGGFLPGYAPALSEAFTEWLEAYRARTTFELTKILIRELRRARTTSDWPTAERIARACLALDPLNEDATLALAEALAITGGKAQAVALLDRYIVEVGGRAGDLQLPAAILKRRIGERIPEGYAARLALPFAGRDREMMVLADRLERARAGDPSCAVLCGDPGIGKTRIASEFTLRASLEGVRVARATAQPHDVHRPMGAFVDLVPQLLKMPGALGCSPASMTALNRLTRHDPSATDDTMATVRQSDELSAGIIRAVGDVVDAIASESVLILWLEDAHWLDEMSLQAVGSLLAAREPRRLFVVLTSRERSATMARYVETATMLHVGPLPDDVVHALTAGALAAGSSGDGAAVSSRNAPRADTTDEQWIVDTAAGNPFFLTCLLSHVQQNGERFAVPSTISGLLDQRIAGLTPESGAVLETCVLLGKYATAERIVSVAQLPHYRLVNAFKELVGSRVATDRDGVLEPSHRLIAEAVRRNAAHIGLTVSHRRIASLLEQESRRTQSPALLWDCSEHWIAAGDVDQAVEVLRECARHAMEIGRPRESAETLLRAAEVAEPNLRTQLLREVVDVAVSSTELDIAGRAVKIPCNVPNEGEHDALEVARFYVATTEPVDVAAHRRAMLRCLNDESSSITNLVAAIQPILTFADQHFDRELATRAFEAAEPFARSDNPFQLRARVAQLIYHSSFGDPDEGVRIARALLACDSLRPAERADVYRKAGVGLWRCGEPVEAIAALKRAYSETDSRHRSRVQFTIALMLATFLTDTGHVEDGKRWLERAEALVAATPGLMMLEVLLIRIDIASASLDPVELNAAYTSAAGAFEKNRSNPRFRRWTDAARILLRHLAGEITDPQESIETLTQHHSADDTGAPGDLEMGVALKISLQSETLAESKRRLDQYLRYHRRGRAPISPLLASCIAIIEAAILAPD